MLIASGTGGRGGQVWGRLGQAAPKCLILQLCEECMNDMPNTAFLTRARRRRVIVVGLCVSVCVSVYVLPRNLCKYRMILIC